MNCGSRRAIWGMMAVSLCGAVEAQSPPFAPLTPPTPRPTVSPYLSLLNRNNSAAFNYYQLYRPQQQFRQAAQQLNVDVNRLQNQLDRRERLGPPGQYQLGATGHQTTFLNYQGYFPLAAPQR